MALIISVSLKKVTPVSWKFNLSRNLSLQSTPSVDSCHLLDATRDVEIPDNIKPACGLQLLAEK